MSKEKTTLETNKINKIKKDYLKLGYSVISDAENIGIHKYKPDLILKLGKEIIIIEVVTKYNINSVKNKLEYFSKLSEKNPNIRFDLIMTNSKPKLNESEKSIAYDKLLNGLYKELYNELEILYKEQKYEYFIDLSNILFENLIKNFAIKRKLIATDTNIRDKELLNILYENKEISKDNYDLFNSYNNELNNLSLSPFELNVGYLQDDYKLLKEKRYDQLKYVLKTKLQIIKSLM